ncbi:methylated-DNA--[protein]-cysteine S-methyltransferase [Streptomyces filamentosus]|uniref:methylated-DNA--[protein]-cysteine S-methyltransferase n=1 Tax=Streptomyces filamentosus TaxID=67294 RepID=UPI001BACB7E7|nr:methylated-DNA--[protein]-cysteine S-methyltransferase [Streptomyces filamentosus]
MDDITVYAYADGPLGEMLLTGRLSAGGRAVLRSLSLPGQKGGAAVGDGWVRDQGAFAEAAGQLEEYFAGRRERFGLPLDREAGTEFQRRVWAALEEIPYGVTVSYGEIGRRVGVAGAGVRAVGTAIGRNPLLVVRPCHRVIGADGTLRGYAAGPERKRSLLDLEGALA